MNDNYNQKIIPTIIITIIHNQNLRPKRKSIFRHHKNHTFTTNFNFFTQSIHSTRLGWKKFRTEVEKFNFRKGKHQLKYKQLQIFSRFSITSQFSILCKTNCPFFALPFYYCYITVIYNLNSPSSPFRNCIHSSFCI